VQIFSFFGGFFTGTSDYVRYCGYIFFVWFSGALADSSDYVCGGDVFIFEVSMLWSYPAIGYYRSPHARESSGGETQSSSCSNNLVRIWQLSIFQGNQSFGMA
jgi:hypothetical protein